MRNWKLIVTASLLISLSAVAQQTAAPSSPQTTQPAASTTQAAAQPTTMDQVVDRTIEREHALMDFLKTRTPLVETYLQNLKLDPQLGPVPSQDHYFLGRIDMAESVDRRDYLSKDSSFQNRLMGGFSKLFKFEYKPMGFSWMIFADREDFDRNHYDFRYVRR